MISQQDIPDELRQMQMRRVTLGFICLINLQVFRSVKSVCEFWEKAAVPYLHWWSRSPWSPSSWPSAQLSSNEKSGNRSLWEKRLFSQRHHTCSHPTWGCSHGSATKGKVQSFQLGLRGNCTLASTHVALCPTANPLLPSSPMWSSRSPRENWTGLR